MLRSVPAILVAALLLFPGQVRAEEPTGKPVTEESAGEAAPKQPAIPTISDPRLQVQVDEEPRGNSLMMLGWNLGYGRVDGGPLFRTAQSGVAFNLYGTYRRRIQGSDLYWGVRAEYAYVNWLDVQSAPSSDLEMHQLLASAVLEFDDGEGNLVPYVLLGGGTVEYKAENFAAANQTFSGGALQWGGGVRYFLGDEIGIHIGPELLFMKDFSAVGGFSMHLSFGFGMHFG